jgi:putative spermidine/putrescine transport system permease protein
MTTRTAPLLAVLPYVVLALALLAVPVAGVVELSLHARSAGSITGGGFSAGNYLRLLEPYYLNLIFQTIKLSFLATAMELLVAFPVAYVLARATPIAKSILGLFVMIPLMTSVVVKTFGWYIIFSDDGALLSGLHALGTGPRSFIGTEFAVLAGMVEFGLPFMIFSLMTAIEKVPRHLEEAAANLGASPWRVLTQVLLPLCGSGVLSGFLLCFGVSASAYVVPAVLGGTKVKMAAQLIYDDVLVAFNWPGAAAVAVVLLLVLAAILYLAMALGGKTDARNA